MSVRLTTFALLIIIAAGCAGSRQAPSPKSGSSKVDARIQAEEAAIATVLQQVRNTSTDYKISAADLLTVTVYREEELSRSLRVSQQGTISFPLIGVVPVAGRSATEAEQAISEKLKEYLVDPQVTVFVKEYANKRIYVLGEVVKPGSYDMPTESRLSVLEAVSLAGGFTPVAAKDRTRVIRSTVDGRSESHTIEVTAITNRGERDKDLFLAPNDVVFVPQSFF